MNLARSQRRPQLAVGIALCLMACSKEAGNTRRAPAPPPPKPPAIKAAPVLESGVAPAVVHREQLLSAVGDAVNAYATGRPSPASVAALAGRRFELKLPFGCHGQPPAEAALAYAWDPKAQKVKFVLKPETWTDAAWVRNLVGNGDTEAIEGFWLSHPWIREPDCPIQSRAAGGASSPETIALVEVFDKGGSRVLRRNGKPYEFTAKLNETKPPPDAGYRLVIWGRFPDTSGPLVGCRSDAPDQRPTCVVRIEFDRVALETADGDRLAEWAS